MENSNELIIPKDLTKDLYDRIKNYVGKEWREEDYEKHFFYIDPIQKPPLYLLVFEVWYKIKISTYKDLKLPNPKPQLQISTEALKILD